MPFNFKQGDAEWTKRRQRALSDLFYFASNVLNYDSYFPLLEETHLLLCRFLQRKTGQPDIDLAPILKCEMPRGTGKTSLGTVALSIQMACANPNTSILIANEKAETAESFLATIKSQFETNDLLRALFPEVIPPDFKQTTWKTNAATLQRTTHRPEPTFQTIGVGGTVTGAHPDHIVADDLISKEAMESARVGAWQIMDRVNRWCNELKLLLNTQAQPFPTICFIGTRWWQGDTYDHIESSFGGPEELRRHYRLTAKDAAGQAISRDVYRVNQLAVFRAAAIENGVAAFPEIHSLERLAELRQDDPELFSCNMMNNPTHAAVRTFQDKWLRYYDRLDTHLLGYRKDDGQMRYIADDNLFRIMVVDPAFTATGSGARAAIVVTGTDAEFGRHLVLEAKAQRAEPRDLVIDILNIAKQHRVSTIYVEVVAQQLAFLQFIQNEARAKNMAVNIEPVKPSGRNKDVRIESLSAFFKGGQILVHRDQLDLLNEYAAYRPGSRFKDTLDALAYSAEKWPMHGPSNASAAGRAKQQLDSYYQRRGLTAV